ncbi:hypothetical protein U1Q18_042341 [Sarracenia purpurea var. burkii]
MRISQFTVLFKVAKLSVEGLVVKNVVLYETSFVGSIVFQLSERKFCYCTKYVSVYNVAPYDERILHVVAAIAIGAVVDAAVVDVVPYQP